MVAVAPCVFQHRLCALHLHGGRAVDDARLMFAAVVQIECARAVFAVVAVAIVVQQQVISGVGVLCPAADFAAPVRHQKHIFVAVDVHAFMPRADVLIAVLREG